MLPRILALVAVMPILVLYADAVGILGGYLVGVGMLGLGSFEYLQETRSSVDLVDISLGLVKAGVFGLLIAMAGCMKGIQRGRSASAVGDAATGAVVTGIVSIIAMTAVFALLTNELEL